jgi:hypothetical protein
MPRFAGRVPEKEKILALAGEMELSQQNEMRRISVKVLSIGILRISL